MSNNQDTDITNSIVNIDKIRALGNSVRFKILKMLIDKGALSWTEIQNNLKMNPNTINFHLTKLIHNDFIKREVIENDKGHPSTSYSALPDGVKFYKKFEVETKV